ncbi:hypothetical protein C1645_871275 [Glomus cerebriforme]|uniref:Uncharacterized protein n=1 Tax=Glomus cerebriforme TaxID=658196 RepID=A0A397TKS0_9GLOM|nr:hypothetical protein C1645_871275 [Glomus cerebriforme]
MLDLPEPLRPVMALKPWSQLEICVHANLLADKNEIKQPQSQLEFITSQYRNDDGTPRTDRHIGRETAAIGSGILQSQQAQSNGKRKEKDEPIEKSGDKLGSSLKDSMHATKKIDKHEGKQSFQKHVLGVNCAACSIDNEEMLQKKEIYCENIKYTPNTTEEQPTKELELRHAKHWKIYNKDDKSMEATVFFASYRDRSMTVGKRVTIKGKECEWRTDEKKFQNSKSRKRKSKKRVQENKV